MLTAGTAAGADGIVNEIWKKIPFIITIVIWLLFKLKIEYGLGLTSSFWRLWQLVGLPKVASPQEFTKYRYVCKSPTLQKWYLKTIMLSMQRVRKPSRVRALGFKKGMNPMFVTELLRRCLHLTHQWKHNVHIASLDVLTAFDLIDYNVLCNALRRRGWPPHFAASVLEQLLDNEAEACIPGLGKTKRVRVLRGGRQGGTETTDLWNDILEAQLADVVARWEQLGYGFTIDGSGLLHHSAGSLEGILMSLPIDGISVPSALSLGSGSSASSLGSSLPTSKAGSSTTTPKTSSSLTAGKVSSANTGPPMEPCKTPLLNPSRWSGLMSANSARQACLL